MEPGPLVYQIAGREIPPGLPYPYMPRVEADPDIFKPQHGVQLTIISDEFDKMMTPAEEMVLYEYLTGDLNHKRLFEVQGEHTCHDTHISDPASLTDLLAVGTFKDAPAENQSLQASEIAIYPNPAANSLSVGYSLDNDMLVEITMFNALGVVVGSMQQMEHVGSHTASIDISHLPAGVYFINYRCGNAFVTRKITKVE